MNTDNYQLLSYKSVAQFSNNTTFSYYYYKLMLVLRALFEWENLPNNMESRWIEKPNYAHRENWWYTKTIDIYISGNIPNEYMNEIKNVYNNGITYWRNPSNFMNYSVSNGIV